MVSLQSECPLLPSAKTETQFLSFCTTKSTQWQECRESIAPIATLKTAKSWTWNTYLLPQQCIDSELQAVWSSPPAKHKAIPTPTALSQCNILSASILPSFSSFTLFLPTLHVHALDLISYHTVNLQFTQIYRSGGASLFPVHPLSFWIVLAPRMEVFHNLCNAVNNKLNFSTDLKNFQAKENVSSDLQKTHKGIIFIRSLLWCYDNHMISWTKTWNVSSWCNAAFVQCCALRSTRVENSKCQTQEITVSFFTYWWPNRTENRRRIGEKKKVKLHKW